MNIRRKRTLRRGFNLIELLIVIGIISMLVQLLIPAVGAAREAARRTQCANQLKQIGIGMTLHHDTYRHYPSGGWHFDWIGEPERGTGREQPGSWIFNVLDYVGESHLRRLGKGLEGEEREEALAKRSAIAIDLFICPSRREVRSYPHTWNHTPYTRGGPMVSELQVAAKTDYAANVGDADAVEFDWRWAGPESLDEGDAADFEWPETKKFTGVVFGRSRIAQRHIKDGTSKTYLVAEKAIDSEQYLTGGDFGDNENMYMGFNNDTTRSTLLAPMSDRHASEDLKNRFGSAHPNTWQAVLCDGSVHVKTFDMDPEVHRALGNRHDVK